MYQFSFSYQGKVQFLLYPILGHSMKIPVPYFRIQGLELPGQNLFRNVPFEGFVPNTGCYLNQRFTVTKKFAVGTCYRSTCTLLQPAYSLHVTERRCPSHGMFAALAKYLCTFTHSIILQHSEENHDNIGINLTR